MAAATASYCVVDTTDGVDYAQDIILETSDEKMYKISRAAVELSSVVKNLLSDDDGGEAKIPLAGVDGPTLESVAQYLCHYVEPNKPMVLEKPLKAALPELLPEWDKKYVYGTLFTEGEEKQHELLFKTLMAANFMGVDSLRDLCCAAVANMLRGKTPEQIMEVFGVTEPFTPEEEAAVEAEYPWLKEAGDAQ